MRGKILFATGMAVGYVLGTRAGRERYEELKRAAQSFWNDPRVKHRVDQVEDFVKEKAPEVAEFVSDGAKKVVDQVTGKSTKKPAAKTTKPSTAAKKPATRTRAASAGSSS
ncbi:MAG: YtxH domain-containing protein [Microcella sp.]|nr:YtxH domain-containing protein [Microcella sp.]